MKKILQLTLAISALLAVTPLRAWNYQDGDALLVFRANNFNDVEFDLGNINQFTNLASGSAITVTNWDLNLVKNTFGSDLTGVSVIVAGTTSHTNANKVAWVSSSDLSVGPNAVTPSTWQARLWSIINSVGNRPLTYNVPTTNGASAYSIDPGGTYALASYDQIVTANGQNSASIAQFGGNAAFTVEQIVPGSFNLWQISPNSANPKPVAPLIGTFTITAAGVLTFTAGGVVPAPIITGITRSGSLDTVSFTTASGGNYWLGYTNQLVGVSTNWPIVSGPVAGDGNNNSLTHTISDSAGFYRVYRTP